MSPVRRCAPLSGVDMRIGKPIYKDVDACVLLLGTVQGADARRIP